MHGGLRRAPQAPRRSHTPRETRGAARSRALIPDHGLEREAGAAALAHRRLQLAREGDDVAGAGALVADDGEGVAAREPDRAVPGAAPEAPAPDEPPRREPHPARRLPPRRPRP